MLSVTLMYCIIKFVSLVFVSSLEDKLEYSISPSSINTKEDNTPKYIVNFTSSMRNLKLVQL